MLLMIDEGSVDTRETGAPAREPIESAGPQRGTPEQVAPEHDPCECHACGSSARDEMWTRWA
jgi:hypothetical protein